MGEDGSKAGELIGGLGWLAGLSVQTVMGVVPHLDRITPLKSIGREVILTFADL